MLQARALLLDNKETIADIAVACGYDETTTFCGYFKQVMDMKAGEYRRRVSGEGCMRR